MKTRSSLKIKITPIQVEAFHDAHDLMPDYWDQLLDEEVISEIPPEWKLEDRRGKDITYEGEPYVLSTVTVPEGTPHWVIEDFCSRLGDLYSDKVHSDLSEFDWPEPEERKQDVLKRAIQSILKKFHCEMRGVDWKYTPPK